MKSKEQLIIFFKGIFIGAAQIIPGLSAGTVALIAGVYEKLIRSLSAIDFKFILYFLRSDFKAAKEVITKIDLKFSIPLVLGIGAGLILMAEIIYFYLDYFPVITKSFFFGLIIVSAVFIFRKEKISLPFLFFGFLPTFLLVGLPPWEIGHSPLVIFFAGLIAVSTMLLPGISGAFMLLLISQYEHLLSVLRNFQLLEIFVFCLGGLAGILFFSKVINYILVKHRPAVISFFIGLMLGGLRLLYQNIVEAMDLSLLIFV